MFFYFLGVDLLLYMKNLADFWADVKTVDFGAILAAIIIIWADCTNAG